MPQALNYLKNSFVRPSFDLIVLSLIVVGSMELAIGSTVWLIFSLSYLALSIIFGTAHRSWRHFSFEDMIVQSSVLALSSTVFLFLDSSLYFSYFAQFGFMTLGLRAARRLYAGNTLVQNSSNKKRKSVVVIGRTNHIGLARALKFHRYDVLGLIEDNDKGLAKSNFPVLGSVDEIETLLNNLKVDVVAIADDLSHDHLQKVMQFCSNEKLTLKRYSSKLEGNDWSLKDFDLHELLGRRKVKVDLSELTEQVKEKNILITGAGGSIGSEVARQIAIHKPERLLILDSSEINLFLIKKELDQLAIRDLEIIPLMVDIKDFLMLDQVFKKYNPHRIYHAAAYKHVHLVQENPYSSIMNNILGTKNLVDLAVKYNLENFLLISTDKAVNPTSIMGSTKRICELIVSKAALKSETQFCSVRFGNVLGSSGSLIPILKKQIAKGGPLTITDPEMRRFFMSIPEAVSLVLKSGCISENGAVNILKMGDEIKIVDVAKKLIHLCGHKEEDIPIIFTGKKAGEKLYEELYLCGDEVDTQHPDIVSLPNGDGGSHFSDDLSLKRLENDVDKIIQLAKENKSESLFILEDIINSTNRKINKDNQEPPKLVRIA